VKAGLAVLSTNDKPLRFGKNWSHEQCDSWLRSLIPQLFEHVDRNPQKSKGRWGLLTKDRNSLSAVAKKKPTGDDFFAYKGRGKASVNDSYIFIGELFRASRSRILAEKKKQLFPGPSSPTYGKLGTQIPIHLTPNHRNQLRRQA
jgi:hypothetical protein